MNAGVDAPGTQVQARAELPSQGMLFTEDTPALDESIGYRGPTVCGAAGVTYRQLDRHGRPRGNPKVLATTILVTTFVPEAAAY